jgi:inorganic triphosphatase YgiF
MGTEVELKLALAPQAAGRLRRHPLLKGCKPTRRKLHSLYFDTAGFELSQRGVALRLRRVGYHWVQTLKAAAENVGAMTSRPEWEVQVTGNRPDLAVLPTEACELLAGIKTEDLRPCFSTEFTRTAWHLVRDDGALELALDQGEVRAGAISEAISEVEFELKAGAGGHLFEVATGFLEGLPFTLEPRSKAERGYLLAGVIKAEPMRAAQPRLTAGQDAGAAWRDMLAAALSQLIANVPGVLVGQDPEYLHQARVAIRRMRALLGLARSLGLDESLWAGDLRWLMGELSPARDWDVIVIDTLPRLPLPWADDTRLAALAEQIAERRAAANARARAALLSGRFVRLVLEAEEGMVEVPNLNRGVDAWAAEVLERRLKRLRRLGKDFRRLDAMGRHALRIAAKRLRYSAEAFATLHAKKAAIYLGALAELQDIFGDANDLVVARRLLGEFDNTPHAYAAGMVEGCMTGAGQERGNKLKRAYERFIDLKPFWK